MGEAKRRKALRLTSDEHCVEEVELDIVPEDGDAYPLREILLSPIIEKWGFDELWVEHLEQQDPRSAEAVREFREETLCCYLTELDYFIDLVEKEGEQKALKTAAVELCSGFVSGRLDREYAFYSMPVMMERQYKAFHSEFKSGGKEAYLWARLRSALLDLPREKFCSLEVGSVPASLAKAFRNYAEPHVEEGNHDLVFEIGVASLGIPGLLKVFESLYQSILSDRRRKIWFGRSA